MKRMFHCFLGSLGLGLGSYYFRKGGWLSHEGLLLLGRG